MSIQVRLLGPLPLIPDVLHALPSGCALVPVFIAESEVEHIGLLVETTKSGEEIPVKVVRSK